MIAMDIKAAPSKYAAVCGLKEIDLSPYEESVRYIMECGIEYEFRTTLVKGLHDMSDMEGIGRWLSGAMAYTLQSYKKSDGVISVIEGSAGRFMTFSDEELSEMLKAVQKHIPCASLRYAS